MIHHLILLEDEADVQFQNSKAPVLVLGAEAEIRREWREGWMLAASYTLQRAQYLQDTNLREVPNYPSHMGSVKGSVPIIGRTLIATTRVTVESPRFDRANKEIDIGCDAANVGTAAPCASQGTTTPSAVWDLVFSGDLERYKMRYSVGVYNLLDWKYDAVPSAEYTQRTIRQKGRTVMANINISF